MADNKYVYLWKNEGDGSMRNLLGGKGANLAEMTRLGMPVPQGFTISTEACTRYYDDGKLIGADIEAQIVEALAQTEEINGKKFGDPQNPLLVSVRSGARASMPGMMDTILNLGLNDEVAAGLIAGNSDPKFARFVYDSYRRFIQMFSDVVMELSKKRFEDIIETVKEKKGVKQDIELDVDDMKELVSRFKAFYKEEKGVDFPTDPKEQLFEAVQAVFRSWDNPRANTYRRMEGIPYSWGTAVNVQPMVFGNLNLNSGTGVAFTRNPATGEPGLYGDYLINAQGEDVVAGVRTASPISELQDTMPEVYDQFVAIAQKLEDHYRDMQDMEFTIENGTLYMLQTRNGKRTAASALKIAIDLVAEGVITVEEAVLRVEPKQLDSLLHPQFEVKALKSAVPIAKGIAASPGAASGRVVFTADDAKVWFAKGEKVILVRKETCPDDIEGMQVSRGILTAIGGKASHAAVVARGMGVCCVAGCSEIKVNYEAKLFTVGEKTVKEGDYISLDGTSGQVYGEILPSVEATISGDFETFMKWADEYRTLKVRTNADTPRDTAKAVEFGAEGVGLCRTEHMFFEGDRIKAMREMIVARDVESRKKALAKILPLQQGDFEAMYVELAGRPMTIRFLDPPLHEFLPTQPAEIADLAKDLGLSAQELTQVVSSLHELNPMMGHRGCRLSVSYPEIAEMQTKAVIRAAIAVNKAHPDFNIVPEIMIPLVGEIKELAYVKKTVTETADAEIKAADVDLKYLVGTMIEIPRAALIADEIAKEAEFFSFGTNDLTQMTFGFSRDDAGTFLDAYYDAKIYEEDPFGTLDQKGVGKLVKMAVELGRQTRPNIKLGICGEHGGDPASVEFCHNIGLNYVSCSPFRVPVARLAAAQAAIRTREA
ncbi:MAG: pyruvate, phosphate dikinase [Oscillospiraceae bacterium]|jgi:pyruvate,orthophosphate dikinase|nr:pyruvate, phosphate dikinase [Oscillospiraceae bacterium]